MRLPCDQVLAHPKRVAGAAVIVDEGWLKGRVIYQSNGWLNRPKCQAGKCVQQVRLSCRKLVARARSCTSWLAGRQCLFGTSETAPSGVSKLGEPEIPPSLVHWLPSPASQLLKGSRIAASRTAPVSLLDQDRTSLEFIRISRQSPASMSDAPRSSFFSAKAAAWLRRCSKP